MAYSVPAVTGTVGLKVKSFQSLQQPSAPVNELDPRTVPSGLLLVTPWICTFSVRVGKVCSSEIRSIWPDAAALNVCAMGVRSVFAPVSIVCFWLTASAACTGAMEASGSAAATTATTRRRKFQGPPI